jgi:hypothetical protein
MKLKKFNQFLLENNNDENILIVVDVQKEFTRFIPQNFVKDLTAYCNNFSTVYQIWDSNKAKGPSYTFPNQKGIYEKKYGTKFSAELKEISKKLMSQNPQENDKFKFQDADSTVVKVDNNHGWFYVNEQLSRFFKTLKGKNVVLVGGADSECLKDVFESLQSYGAIPKYDYNYIYSAKTSNKQVHTIKN